eukprot:gene42246-56116_t
MCTVTDQIFSKDDIDFFGDNGYIKLRGAFSKAVAASCRKVLENVLEEDGISVGDKSTWIIRKGLSQIYKESAGEPWSNVFTPRLKKSIDELCGENNWNEFGCGWWVITFPNICSPPWEVDGHWHVDGAWHQHYPYSKEIGLVPVMLFSDILPQGGGTAVAKGSHKLVTRILLESGMKGCKSSMIASAAIDYGLYDCEIEEITGDAGDIVFLHPHLLHARSTNLGTDGVASIRYMCHPAIELKQHLNFNVDIEEMTPIMRAML